MNMDIESIIDYFKSGFSLINIETFETNRAIDKVIKKVQEYNEEKEEGEKYILNRYRITDGDPIKVINEFIESTNKSILIVENLQFIIDKPIVIQSIKNGLENFEAVQKHIVGVSNNLKFPKELEKDFIQLEMNLPKEKEIGNIIESIIPDKKYFPDQKELPKIVEALKGLTEKEIENTLSLSLVQKKKIDIEVINNHKEQEINKSGFLKVLKSEKTFQDIVGYEKLKKFILNTIENPEAKGIMLIGPPGTGKTSLAEAITNEVKKFGIVVDMGKLFSKFVGDTDKNIDLAIKTITAIGNCFVLIDEFEKQFSGANSDGSNDSGVTKRALSKWLDFLQNRPKGIYICATANSFKGIPPEYLRPGRWDTSPFFVDFLSGDAQQNLIDFYSKKYNKKQVKIDLKDFSGAEVESLFKIMNMLDIDQDTAMAYIKPIAQIMEVEIKEIRTWANKNCIATNDPIEKKNGRKISMK